MTELIHLQCPSCGVEYAIPKAMYDARGDGRFNKEGWQCPNGHTLVRSENGTPLDQERRARQLAEQRLAQKADEALEERRAKEKVERKLKRLNRGVCTCCRRSFQNLKRHMETQHPQEIGKPKLVASKA